MSDLNKKSLHEITDAYSPIIRGKTGFLGRVLTAIARPLEALRDIVSAIAHFPFGFGHENAAGQILTDCPALVPDTFRRMEKQLRKSFNAAARNGASPIERETFLRLADSVRTDANALAKHCTILRTEFDNVTEKYNFIVAKEPAGRKINLEEGVALVKGLNVPASDADGAGINPVTIRRKPIELQSRPQASAH